MGVQVPLVAPMIELVDAFIVGPDQAKLEALQVLLADFTPDFTFSLVENEAKAETYKLLVGIQEGASSPDMASFLDFLSNKIAEVNQQN